MEFHLLKAFRKAFEGRPYYHRDSSVGDRVALWLYEDLVRLGRSRTLKTRVATCEVVLNARNLRVGIPARRGDGSLGELVPGTKTVKDPEFLVSRGHIANIQIGVEVKILAKSMIKQIGRVTTDLQNQVRQFKKGGGKPICIGIVGINHAEHYHSFEGEKEYDTEGTGSKPHPAREAAEAEARLDREAKPDFDEFLFLRYRATNVHPFPFEWKDEKRTERDYGALLIRVSRKYDEYFG